MIGFGGSSISNNGKASIEKNNPRKPTAISHNDPFLVFESTTSSKSFLDSLEQITKNVIYVNSYGIFQDIISNPSAYGFSVINVGCRGVGRNNGQITCLPIVHRDIKPKNILVVVDDNMEHIIADFGTALRKKQFEDSD
uniref:Protein kinase n=1 Tax=Medicago truncatula TaxID=3880 RepID=Q2HSI8_MEDTR|nr:Protein kinase [Medicago truncatula]